MLLREKPGNFNPKFEIVSCFLEHNGKFLLLHRQDHKREGNTWGVPAGKVEANEPIDKATVREVFEETGIKIPAHKLNYWGKVFVQYPIYDFVYHRYFAQLLENNAIRINPNEHKDFKWVTPQEALKLPLIPDEDTGIKLFYRL